MTSIYKHCDYCNKGIKYQNHWIRHTKTKKHLKNVEKVSLSIPKVSQKVSFSIPKVSLSIPEEKEHEPSRFSCNYCDKTFTKKNNMYRHQKKSCKSKPVDQTINNTTNNNCNNNNTQNITQNDNKTINNTININVQGGEDLKNIIDSDMYHKLGGMEGLKILELYLDEVYVNKEENSNVKYTNMRSNKCRTLQYQGNDKKWCIDNIDKVIDKRIQLSPMKLNKMIKQHLKTYGEERRLLEEATRKKIYDSLYRITTMVYQNKKPELVEQAKVTPKEKQGYKDLYEDHKMTLYNNTD